ncbi:ankyrin repeat domain-containing protein [Limnobacter parvus]|uniref:Ankyrin repeat domain-containing protein n=1 Tax=Limnobacter parvus TaxID=2939690 RepID=A0ABT1XE89_9BURK|nr:ankyrin repeat domain-containing protein [Limnobacter parvus]MCR2745575.1 ankyrin repeat domain-containing protein [Limnobacter parvus]
MGRITLAQDAPNTNSLGHFILRNSQIALPFQSAIAADPEHQEKYWDEKVTNVLDKEIISFMENTHASDTQAPSFTRYGIPAAAYKAWGDCVQEPAVHALYSGIPVSRKQLNTYFAEGRKRLAQEAAEITAMMKNQDLDGVKAKFNTDFFGADRLVKLLTPLGDDGPYEPHSHRAIDLMKNGSKEDVFRRIGHLTLDKDTLRFAISNVNDSPKPDALALLFSVKVGKLRLDTTSTYLSASFGKQKGIDMPSNMSRNWNKEIPEIFWRHSPVQNIPYLETLCSQCYESIVDEKHLPIDLIDKILHLHYLESHLCKFARGSAAINGWQTESLLKAYGAGQLEMPENLDCLALSHNLSSDFIQEVHDKYPEFTKILIKIRQPETLPMQLCDAIKHRDDSTSQLLLQDLLTVELMQVKSPSGLGLMQLAAKYDNSSMVNQLVNAGIPASHSHDERTPLMLAIRNNAIHCALQLVERMAPHEIEPLIPGRNHPLHHLIIADQPECELLLLAEALCMKLAKNNQNLNSPDSRGETPAQLAKKMDKPLLEKIIETQAQHFR